VTNSVGDTAVLPIEVEVYEDSYEERNYRPVIYLNGYVAYVTRGSAFDAYTYIDHISDQSKYYKVTEEILEQQEDAEAQETTTSDDLIPASEIHVTSNVDTASPGVYSVVYNYTSEKTNYEGNANLIVVVE
jgi:hypothetical protein